MDCQGFRDKMNPRSDCYQAALYMRLSKDDEGSGAHSATGNGAFGADGPPGANGSSITSGTSGPFGESASITNQRNLLRAYAKEHGFTVAAEYVDDGYSGTSFQRPGFQQMLRDIEAQKINLVLTKDLSRLGRDYIQTGQYTEVYFPSKKVRFIAVNDGFDSDGPYTDIAPFRHVVNEMYARDTSRKIRSAFSTKMKNGSFIGNFAPYGYQKDPLDKNHLVPDETSAPVVGEIFRRAAQGIPPTEIARWLSADGVLTPALYRRAQSAEPYPADFQERKDWTAAGVSKLLRNIVYLGHMAQGKTTKVSFKSKQTLRNPPKDWIVVENTHEPLVDAEVFDAAHRRMKSRICEKKGQFTNLFTGIARCADCGRPMSAVGSRKKDAPFSLACGGYKLYGKEKCSNHFIPYDALYRIVLEAVREQTALTAAEREELNQVLRQTLHSGSPKTKDEQEMERLREEKGKLDRLIEWLYDDRLGEKISEERFYALLKKYEEQSGRLREKMRILEDWGCKKQHPSTPEPNSPSSRLELALDIRELTADMLFTFLERIDIGQGWYENTAHGRVKHQEVWITFRFSVQTETREVTE